MTEIFFLFIFFFSFLFSLMSYHRERFRKELKEALGVEELGERVDIMVSLITKTVFFKKRN